MKEAMFYEKKSKNMVQCHICPRNCVIADDKIGFCRARKNVGGTLYSIAYGKVANGLEIDPVEKKPLYHFLPGSTVLSFGTAGCNLRCHHCFLPSTYIVTDKGAHRIDQIFDSSSNQQLLSEGTTLSEVKSLKVATHKNNFLEVKKASAHFYKGNIIELKPYYTPKIEVTPEHKFFVHSKRGIIKKEAKELSKEDILLIPKKFNTVPKQGILNVADALRNIEKRDIKRSNRKLTKPLLRSIVGMKKEGLTSRQINLKAGFSHPAGIRNLLSKMRKRGFEGMFTNKAEVIDRNGFVRLKWEKEKGIPAKICIDNELAELFGYYAAEGCVIRSKCRANSCKIQFTFGNHENHLIKRTAYLLEKIFCVIPSVEKRRTGTSVSSGKTSLAKLFMSLAGKGSREKNVPQFIFQSDKETIKSFLKAYLYGDGWNKGDIISANTVSKTLALGIYELFLRLGYLPHYYEWIPPKKKVIEGRLVNQSALYYVKLQGEDFIRDFFGLNKLNLKRRTAAKFRETEDYFLVPIRTISERYYEGPVYNLEVEGDHSYSANFIAVANCQNWSISQRGPDDPHIFSVEFTPEQIVEQAIAEGCESIAYTYTEPTIFYEFVLDTAKLAKEKGIKNIIVSNGFINPEPLKEWCKYIDAANIDLKGNDAFYKRVSEAWLKPVQDTMITLKNNKVWLEDTTLIIPKENDDEKQIKGLMDWFEENLGFDVPWHFTAFYPCYKMMDHLPTREDDLVKIRKKALDRGFRYVYAGNILNTDTNTTYCPKCKEPLIGRLGFSVKRKNINDNKCGKCNAVVKGVFL